MASKSGSGSILTNGSTIPTLDKHLYALAEVPTTSHQIYANSTLIFKNIHCKCLKGHPGDCECVCVCVCVCIHACFRVKESSYVQECMILCLSTCIELMG